MSDDTDLRFSDDERRDLAHVLDQIIPPRADGRLPGAGELGLVRHIEENVLRQTPEMRPAIAQGLAVFHEAAAARDPRGFAALAPAARRQVLDELEAKAPGFVAGLVFPVYLGYYQHPRVVEGLGLGSQPPHPRGYEMAPNDLTLLEPVRRRAKLYRDC